MSVLNNHENLYYKKFNYFYNLHKFSYNSLLAENFTIQTSNKSIETSKMLPKIKKAKFKRKDKKRIIRKLIRKKSSVVHLEQKDNTPINVS